MIALIVGIGVTADPDLTLPKATGLILGLAWWRFLVLTIQNKRQLRWGLVIFILMGLGFILFGILGINWVSEISFLARIIDRLPSQMILIPESPAGGVGANQLAGTLLIPLMLVLSILFGWRPIRRPKLAIIGVGALTALIGGVLILTQSRSGWIGGIGGLFVLLVLWGRILPPSPLKSAIWLILGVFIISSVIGLAAMGPEKIIDLWNNPNQETVIGQFGTVGFRLEVWQWALAGIQDFPFTGAGLGSFRRVVQRLYPIGVPFDYDIAHAHNIFLQVALDLGLPGLVIYLALLIITAVIGLQVAKQDEQLRPFALGILAGLAAIHIYGQGDTLALGSKPNLLFWVSLGLVAAMKQILLSDEVE
ncbi:MAG: hypothetical protein GY803_01380 [Chloroflexi bacterium]|nr:hypothetical protein [Chloroflexota bacterium]